MLLLACLLAAAAAAPATYDQRQDGDFNVRADVQNVVFLIAYPSKLSIPTGILDGLVKSAAPQKQEPEIQDRADVNLMEAFVEPNTPYHVEIGESGRYVDGDSKGLEVVIAGRRRLETENQENEAVERDELKLLGAMEQCGPDGERDPVTMSCRTKTGLDQPPAPAPLDAPQHDTAPTDNKLEQKAPEIIPVLS